MHTGKFSLFEIYFQEKWISIHKPCPLIEQEWVERLETILFHEGLFLSMHHTVLHVLSDAVEDSTTFS